MMCCLGLPRALLRLGPPAVVSTAVGFVFAVLCFALAPPTQAQAEGPLPLKLSSEGCAGLDQPELARLLALELASLGVDPNRPVQVVVACTTDSLRLRVSNPREVGYLERVLPRSAVSLPGDERVLALSVTQLVLTASQALPKRAAPLPSQPPATPEQRTWIALGAGLRLHDWAATLPLWHVTALAQHQSGRWGLLGALDAALGEREQALGVVEVMRLSAAFGPALRLVNAQRFELWTLARAGAAYVRARGEPAQGFGANSVHGVGALLEAGLLPTLRLAPVRLALSCVLGAELGSPQAQVQNERSVRTKGLYGTATLLLAIELGKSLTIP